jgi:hypothetical protein
MFNRRFGPSLRGPLKKIMTTSGEYQSSKTCGSYANRKLTIELRVEFSLHDRCTVTAPAGEVVAMTSDLGRTTPKQVRTQRKHSTNVRSAIEPAPLIAWLGLSCQQRD